MKSSHQSNFCYLPRELFSHTTEEREPSQTTFYRFISTRPNQLLRLCVICLLNENKWEINSALPKKKYIHKTSVENEEKFISDSRTSLSLEWFFFEWKTGSKFMCQTSASNKRKRLTQHPTIANLWTRYLCRWASNRWTVKARRLCEDGSNARCSLIVFRRRI